MPLVNCDMPGNAWFFFIQIYTIASFNLIDVSSITSKISEKLTLQNNQIHISSRMQGFGFDSTSQINNLGIVFLFFMLVGLYLLLLAFMSCIGKVKCKKVVGGGKKYKW